MRKIILLATIICFTGITNAQRLIEIDSYTGIVEWIGASWFKYNIQNRTEIDTSKSIVKWTGSNLFKYNKHFGTVNFINGHIINSNDVILGGYFEINMNSIVNTDGKYNEMLVSHLKNKDFFDVDKYPIAKIKFTEVVHKNVNTIKVKADLTIKNITNQVHFNIKYKVVDGRYEMNSKFIIDRTRWGIEYQSKGLFANIKNDIISDAIEFEVVIQLPLKDGC
ncbi:YceI family protein [Flavivirga amylovorans]|uniref:YceI family protein n=1 Tax=Flavivirga amylovorans TaxID=870486 RepID=A0ABT8X5V3_9FLAO|nr:YceI family protein [Flavivirga amylovorans]MDO5989381.1 YceI family protein [Flavivirga amylovorans]